MNLLSDTPSNLILDSLKDLEACEQDPRYVIDMGWWHVPKRDVTHVCLAGSVMAKTLGAVNTQHTSPNTFSEVNKLRALNYFRLGYVWLAFMLLNIRKCPFMRRDITPYENNPKQFKADMYNLANELKEYGF